MAIPNSISAVGIPRLVLNRPLCKREPTLMQSDNAMADKPFKPRALNDALHRASSKNTNH